LIDEEVWKWPQHCLTVLSECDLVLKWILLDKQQRFSHHPHKSITRGWTLLPVPSCGSGNIGLHLTPNNKLKLHPKRVRRRAMNCSSGMALLGSRSCSAIRRSISAF